MRTLVDVPSGTFICNYIGVVLTDNQAEKYGQLVILDAVFLKTIIILIFLAISVNLVVNLVF